MTENSPLAKRPRTSSTSSAHHISNSATSSCPYLSTVNHDVIDLDLKPQCSVTLSVQNVYICLICSRYLQGRAPSTAAFMHSLQAHHHLFLCIRTLHTYCLPDNYRVDDRSLRQISLSYSPNLTMEDIAELDTEPFHLKLPKGSRLRGAVPLAHLRAADYISATTQLLLSAPQFRDSLLRSVKQDDGTAACSIRNALADVCKKIWSKHALRDFIAPHELLDVVETLSPGLFTSLKQNDPVLLLAWMLNTITENESDPTSQLAKKSFKGHMTVVETALPASNVDDLSSQPHDPDAQQDKSSLKKESKPPFHREKRSSFWYLPLDLPPEPLFKDLDDRTLVTQTTLEKLLRKYDGVTRQHVVKTANQRSFRLDILPNCLVLVVKRFVKSKFGVTRNPCIVHLTQTLDMSEFCPASGTYDLKAAILHEGRTKGGVYKVAIKHNATGSWFELNGIGRNRTHFQLVSLADTYVLLYERKTREAVVANGDKEK